MHTHLSPNLKHRSEILEEHTAVANPRMCPSPSPALQPLYNGSMDSQFCTNLGMQLAGLRKLIYPRNTPFTTPQQHLFKSICILRKLTRTVLVLWIDTFKGTRDP